jgi:hypothetical protein
VPTAVRSTDLAGLVGERRAGVLLIEQDADGASQAVERIRERMQAAGADDVSWEHRLLWYPQDGAEISDLLTAGWDGRRGSRDVRSA